MEFGVLGPLLLADEDRSLLPSAPKGRHLLALLMINANHVVPVQTCIDELWQADPPKSAVATVQTYVLQIRKSLLAARRPVDREALVWCNSGYRLNVPASSFDRARFDSIVGDGDAAVVRGDDRTAVDLYDSAILHWRGSALCDVLNGPAIETYRLELEEVWLRMLEQRIEAYLRLGRHREVLGQLRTLADSHPTHENVQAQLMLALYRSGRRAEAIDLYHRLRRLLVENFALDPSPRIRCLYEAMLTADPVLELASPRFEYTLRSATRQGAA